MHWSVIYDSLGEVWMMKSNFVKGHVRSVLTSLKFSNIIYSTSVATMIYIFKTLCLEKIQSGSARTKKGGKSGTVGRMSFVFSIMISEEAFGLTRLRNILDKVMWSLKARPHNPMGKLIWDYCKK
jgi:hypothetical protein